MKKSLSEFSSQELKRDSQKLESQKNSEEDIYKEYDNIKNLSQEEAKNRLFQEVFKQKQNGTFDFSGLEKQVENLKGYLPEKDYASLKKMLESLR